MKKSSRHGANFGFGADIIHTSKTRSINPGVQQRGCNEVVKSYHFSLKKAQK